MIRECFDITSLKCIVLIRKLLSFQDEFAAFRQGNSIAIWSLAQLPGVLFPDSLYSFYQVAWRILHYATHQLACVLQRISEFPYYQYYRIFLGPQF